MYDAPSYIWVFVLLGVVGIIATTSLVLYRGAVAARLRSATSLRVAAAVATLLGGFILATGLLAGAGVYQEDSGQAAPFFGVAFVTILIASLLLVRVLSSAASSPIPAPSPGWLCPTRSASWVGSF